jgi:hypothetical protein
MPFYTQIHMLVVHEAVPARNAAEFVVLRPRAAGRATHRASAVIFGDFFAKIFDRVNGRITNSLSA